MSISKKKKNSERVILYIDGFNLYHGLRDKKWKRYYWLNLKLLGQNLLKPWQTLVGTKYFTAKISNSNDPGKVKRQSNFLEALETVKDLKIFYGHYIPKPQRCFKCGATWNSHEEKMTDVNISVQLMGDAFNNSFDTAMVLSADSDLSPPIRFILENFPTKKVIAIFPPKRRSDRIRKEATSAFTLGRKVLSDSQFPDRVSKSDGFVLKRPVEWN